MGCGVVSGKWGVGREEWWVEERVEEIEQWGDGVEWEVNWEWEWMWESGLNMEGK